MDITLIYIVFIFNIIYIVNSINPPSQHISDYILSFETYHFEWNKQYFESKTLKENGDNDITTTTEIACTVDIPSLCINYTPKKVGFTVLFNDSKYDFMKNNDWTQINYIHANDSITLYDDKYNSQIMDNDNNIIDYQSIDSEEDEEEFEKYESYDDDDDILDDLNEVSPNPAFAGRRLLRRRRAKCRVYLYGSSGFRRRRGGTFRRRRYRRSSLSKKGIRSGESIRSIKVRGSRCCTAKIYRSDNFRGRRVRFRRGSYRSLRSRRRRISRIGSMKVYCSRSRRRGSRRGRRRRCPCNSCPCDNQQPIPILLGPMTGMLGHFGYSMHPIMPPQMGAMAGMMGGYGSGMGMPIMSHPAFGHPTMGHGHGFGMGMGGMGGMGMMGGMMPGMMGMGGMGGMGMMNPMMLNPMYSGMGMGGMYGQQGMNQQQGKTPVVDVYTDGHKRRRLAMKDDRYNDGVALKKCVVIDGGEICVTYYFGQMLLTLDYTIMKSKILRIDEALMEDQDNIMIDDIEFIEDSQDSDDYDESDEQYFEDDDYFSEWLVEHEEYELWRNEKIFKFPIDVEIENDFKSTNGIDYINTLPWIWNKNECNDHVLSFLNTSICTNSTKDMNNDDDILIFTKYIGNDQFEIDEFELDDLKMNVRNSMDWDEIYDINMFNEEKINNKKLCRISSLIKFCVEIAEDQYLSGNIKEMQMSVEFL